VILERYVLEDLDVDGDRESTMPLLLLADLAAIHHLERPARDDHSGELDRTSRKVHPDDLVSLSIELVRDPTVTATHIEHLAGWRGQQVDRRLDVPLEIYFLKIQIVPEEVLRKPPTLSEIELRVIDQRVFRDLGTHGRRGPMVPPWCGTGKAGPPSTLYGKNDYEDAVSGHHPVAHVADLEVEVAKFSEQPVGGLDAVGTGDAVGVSGRSTSARGQRRAAVV
jgi:hypothetical protein